MNRRRVFDVDIFDEFLENHGLFRKNLAKDGTCLFRAVAEKVYRTQSLHRDVRDLCIKYMLLNKREFQSIVEIPLEQHLENLRDASVGAGYAEIVAMSQIFKLDFEIYREIGQLPSRVTDNNYKEVLTLSCTNGSHYDIVYKAEDASSRGFCQSLMYNLLYTRVFKMKDVDVAVDKMLHDRDYDGSRRDLEESADLKEIGALVEKVMGATALRDSSLDETDKGLSRDDSLDEKYKDLSRSRDYSQDEGDKYSDERLGSATDVKELLACGKLPFAYRVAKSLDPDIYRNIELDSWNLERREARYGPYDSKGLHIGAKVLVNLEMLPNRSEVETMRNEHLAIRQSECDKNGTPPEGIVFHGHIQNMSEDRGPVNVFVEEVGKRLEVPYKCLIKVPHSPPRSAWPGCVSPSVPGYSAITQYYKNSPHPSDAEYSTPRSGKKKINKELVTVSYVKNGKKTNKGSVLAPKQQRSYHTPKHFVKNGRQDGSKYYKKSPEHQEDEGVIGSDDDSPIHAVTLALQQVMSAGGQQVRVRGQQLEVVGLEEHRNREVTIKEVSQDVSEASASEYEVEGGPVNCGSDEGTGSSLDEDKYSQSDPSSPTVYLYKSVTGEMIQGGGYPSNNSSMYAVVSSPNNGMFLMYSPMAYGPGTPVMTPPPNMAYPPHSQPYTPTSEYGGSYMPEGRGVPLMTHPPPFPFMPQSQNFMPMPEGDMPMLTPYPQMPMMPHTLTPEPDDGMRPMSGVSPHPYSPSSSDWSVVPASSTPPSTPFVSHQHSMDPAVPVSPPPPSLTVYYVPVMYGGGYEYPYNWGYPPTPNSNSPPVGPPSPMDFYSSPVPPPHRANPNYYGDGHERRDHPPFGSRGGGRGRFDGPHHYRPMNHYNHHNNFHQGYRGPSCGKGRWGKGRGGGPRFMPPRYDVGYGEQHPRTPLVCRPPRHQLEGQPLYYANKPPQEKGFSIAKDMPEQGVPIAPLPAQPIAP